MTTPPLAPAGATASPRPVRSPLAGRDVERLAVLGLLADHRLVTLTGPAGVGKTRLATAVADASSAPATSVCELLALPDASGVETAVAEALGFPHLAGAVVGLGDDEHLLVLDNTEHVTDEAARVIDHLLRSTGGLRVLATGRQPLAVEGEHLLVLDPLALPDGDDLDAVAASPAVQLFVARAAAAGAPWSLDADTAPVVAAVCRRLDGLPLAIELAASRSRVLAPREVLRHLDARFDLLTRRAGSGQAHHRSLDAAIAWSHERLDPPTRAFFDRLGAFVGPFTLEAAHAVAGEPDDDLITTIDRLDHLVGRSMVVTSVRRGGTAYELLETLRLYARERLHEAGTLQACDRRCVDHHVSLALDLLREGMEGWSDDVFRHLLDSQLNLQDALRWCLAEDEDPDRAYVLFVPLWGLVHNARAEVVAELGTRLLETWDQPDHPLWPIVVATHATALVVAGDPEHGLQQAARVTDRPEEDLGTVLAERARHLALFAHDGAAAGASVRRALELAEALDAGPYRAELVVFAALDRVRRDGDATAGLAMLDGLASARPATLATSSVLTVWWQLATAAITSLQDRDRARALAQDAADVATRADYPFGRGTGHRLVGALALRGGDLPAAVDHLGQSLDTFVAAGHLAEVAATLRWVAALAVVAGRVEVAPSVLVGDVAGPVVLDLLDGADLDDRLAGVSASPGGASLAVPAARRLLDELRRMAAPTKPPTQARPAGSSLVREGDVWALTWRGATVRVADAKGLHDLARLLGAPGREVAATELMGAVLTSGDLGAVLDPQARRAYERRIIELQAELEEAEEFHDLERADRTRDELDGLVDQLAAATGLHGRDRRPGREAEKARSAVTWRIRAAIGRIAQLHSEAGAHLQQSVRTGTWCAYEPVEPVAWTVEADGQPVS